MDGGQQKQPGEPAGRQAGQEQPDGQPEGRGVELGFELTTDELRQAVKLWGRLKPAQRRTRLGAFTVLLLALTLYVVRLVNGRSGPSVWLGGLAVVLIAFAVAVPWLETRRLGAVARQTGEIRATVEEAGLLVSTRDTSSRLAWTALPVFTETDELFVLFRENPGARGLQILPKRGLRDPADADRLRALLERNILTRV